MFEFIGTSIILALIFLVLGSWIVSKAADKLGDVLHVLGIKLNIPTSVRGATLDAVSSSFPEFCTAMIAVLVYKDFTNVGVPTIAGSGIFNVLLIPMASIFAFKGKDLYVKVERKVIYRDMIFYTLAVGILILSTYLGEYTPIVGIILFLVYLGYIVILYNQTKVHRRMVAEGAVTLEEDEEEDMTYPSIFMWIVITIAFVWISIDAIIYSAGVVATTLSIPKYIVSVIIIAACTSIPDTLLSVKSAKKGDAEGAVSNAVGSNIFDICICLGVPMMIAGKTIKADFTQNIGVLIFVLISMVTTALLLLKKDGVKKKDGFIMLFVYLVFIVYVIGEAFKIWG